MGVQAQQPGHLSRAEEVGQRLGRALLGQPQPVTAGPQAGIGGHRLLHHAEDTQNAHSGAVIWWSIHIRLPRRTAVI